MGIEEYGDNDFYGTSYFVHPRGQFGGDPASDGDEELLVRDLDLGMIDEVRSQPGVLPGPPPGRLRPAGPAVRTRIEGGTVLTAADQVRADVLIDGETVVAVAAPGAVGFEADTVFDATGCWVIPGGVDAHTHMEMPFGGTFASDTFETGTRAAAWGGTTTIVDFAIQSQGASLREGLDTWHAKAEGNAAIDYGFHMILSDVNDASLKEMESLVSEGVTSFKMFMAYPGVFYSDDGRILRAMQRAGETGGLTMIHAENGIAIDVLVEQALAAGRTDPRYHGEVRHALLEAEATHRAIALARVAGARSTSCTCPRPRRSPRSRWPGRRV